MNTDERKPEGKEAERLDTEEAREIYEDFVAKEEERWRPVYEKALEVVDPDIAEAFKNFGVGGYHLDFPIKLQIARSLKKLVRLLEQKESEKVEVRCDLGDLP